MKAKAPLTGTSPSPRPSPAGRGIANVTSRSRPPDAGRWIASKISSGYTRTSRLAFVGAGRLGSSLAFAAAEAGYKVTAVSSRRSEHREWLATRLPDVRVAERAADAAEHADIVLITASDAAVAQVCQEIAWRPGQAAVHCAGALPVSALDFAASCGAATGGLHPLQTFPSPDSWGRLKGVVFAAESADAGLAPWLRQFARDLGGSPFEITSGQRAAYHASAVMASGLLAGLAGLAAEMWSQFGVPRDRALASLAPLIESTARSLREHGLPAAMTGPYVRGDVQTVAMHLEVMAAQSHDVAHAYAALALAQMHIAAEQGSLTESAQQAIEGLLREALEGGESHTVGVVRSKMPSPTPHPRTKSGAGSSPLPQGERGRNKARN